LDPALSLLFTFQSRLFGFACFEVLLAAGCSHADHCQPFEHNADRCQPFEHDSDRYHLFEHCSHSSNLPGIAVPPTSEIERSVDTALATALVPLFVPKASQTIVTDEKMTKDAVAAVAAKEQSFAATDAMEFEGYASQLEDLAAIAHQRGEVGVADHFTD
jgi:hypothetical protein